MAEAVPLLQARALTKRFPGVLAVDAVDFEVHAGEVVALLGANGAGKSTLIQMFAGVHPHGSYDGDIRLGDEPFAPRSVAQAESAGVALVPQEIQVVPELSIAANLFLHAEPARWGVVDQAKLLADARQALRDFGLRLDVRAPIGTLDLATQQLVIIVRALSKRARVLILDEPTAALTDNEAQRLFDKLRELCERGVGVIFVSHRLAEVFRLSQRIVVMRDGRVCGNFRTAETTREQVVSAMVGATIRTVAKSAGTDVAEAALQVSQLVVRNPATQRATVQGLDFTLHRGEVLGLFGLLGAGCNEAALAVYGASTDAVSGRIAVDGRDIDIHCPADAIASGIGLMAQDRRDCLSGDHSILDNVLLASLERFSRRGWVDWLRFRRRVMELAERLNIKAPSVDVAMGSLSGGNQQKVQIARWLAAEVRVLLLVDPTRGVDVGARAELTRVWRELTERGQALLLVSSEAEELVEVCDRVLVLRQGRMCAELAGDELNEEALLRAAAGV
jgi:ABC-type sugar transport system ATPase subunit